MHHQKAFNIFIKYFHLIIHSMIIKSRAERPWHDLQSFEKGRWNISSCWTKSCLWHKSTNNGNSDSECSGSGVSGSHTPPGTHEIYGTNTATKTRTNGAKCYRHVKFRSENAENFSLTRFFSLFFAFFSCVCESYKQRRSYKHFFPFSNSCITPFTNPNYSSKAHFTRRKCFEMFALRKSVSFLFSFYFLFTPENFLNIFLIQKNGMQKLFLENFCKYYFY